MGIFDSSFFNSANDLLNKSASKVSNALDSASNKMKLAEQQRKRAEACAALGAAVYAESKDDAEFRAKYDELFTAVESVDEAIAEIEAQISAGEAQKAAAAAAAADAAGARICGCCGAAIAEGALFCGNCGTKVPEPEPVSATRMSPQLGNRVPRLRRLRRRRLIWFAHPVQKLFLPMPTFVLRAVRSCKITPSSFTNGPCGRAARFLRLGQAMGHDKQRRSLFRLSPSRSMQGMTSNGEACHGCRLCGCAVRHFW